MFTRSLNIIIPGFLSSQEFDVRIVYMSYQCYVSSNAAQTAMLAILFAYLALLQIIGIILAIQTRKVKIKLLNDSKYIAALIYTSSLVLILIGVVSFTATSIPNIGEALTSGGLWVVTVLFLSLVFIPKVDWITYLCIVIFMRPTSDHLSFLCAGLSLPIS